MKKLVLIVTTLLLAVALVACGGGDAPAPAPAPEPAPADTPEPAPAEEETPEAPPTEPGLDLDGFAGTKTGAFYSQFPDNKMNMKYEMDFEGQKMVVVSVTDGEKIYAQTEMDGVSMGETIMDGEYMYTIDHDSKMVIKMSLGIGGQEGLIDTVLEESEVDMGDLTTGSREIEGKTYDTEEWTVEGMTSVMCFDGDQLAYMISSDGTDEYIIKVLEVSGDVDPSLFEIPADYTLMEF